MGHVNRTKLQYVVVLTVVYILRHPPPTVQTLAGFGDLVDFYDVVDSLEEQGIEKCMDVSM